MSIIITRGRSSRPPNVSECSGTSGRIVRVQPKYPIAGRTPQALVPCRGKIIAPRKVVNIRREAAGDRLRCVLRASIDDHDFIDEVRHRRQASLQILLFITDVMRPRNAESYLPRDVFPNECEFSPHSAGRPDFADDPERLCSVERCDKCNGYARDSKLTLLSSIGGQMAA